MSIIGTFYQNFIYRKNYEKFDKNPWQNRITFFTHARLFSNHWHFVSNIEACCVASLASVGGQVLRLKDVQFEAIELNVQSKTEVIHSWDKDSKRTELYQFARTDWVRAHDRHAQRSVHLPTLEDIVTCRKFSDLTSNGLFDRKEWDKSDTKIVVECRRHT